MTQGQLLFILHLMQGRIESTLNSIYHKSLKMSNNLLVRLSEKVGEEKMQWIYKKYDIIKEFAKKNPQAVVAVGSVMVLFAAWKFRGGNDGDGTTVESSEMEQMLKEEMSTGIKSDESLLIGKGQMEAIMELDNEDQVEDRLFFEFFKKYQQT